MAHPIIITPLFEHPELVRTVAEWIYNEFWTDKPEMSADILEGWLCDAASETAIPLSWLAWVDGAPAGTVNLIANDNPNRLELTPWVAALLVRPEFRLRGIGTQLMQAAARGGESLGFARLYLGTDIPDFYERLGWQVFESVRADYCIMSLDTGQAGGRTDSCGQT